MRSLVRIPVMFLCCLLLAHCSHDSCLYTTDLRLPEPDVVIPNLVSDISIGYGQTVLIAEDDLYITFKHVMEGRCPIGAACFWEGQATTEFRIDVPGKRPTIVKPVIRPSSEPGKSPDMTDYGRGYSFTLLQLDPYPSIEHDYVPEDYSAILMVEKVSDDVPVDLIIPTWSPPGLLQDDPVVVREGSIDGDVLRLIVMHSGGCGDHAFKLFWRPTFIESYPVQTDLFLQHVNLGDFCEAIITTELFFDIREITERCAAGHDEYEDIILNVYGYFEDEPGERISVTYSPE